MTDEAIPRSGELMSRDDTALLVVDVQDKLIHLIPQHQRLVWNIRRLVDAATLLNVPTAVTEQYPEGLGGTTATLADRLPPPRTKRDFSCAVCGDLFSDWRSRGVDKILLAGIETHVCILQTALDLIADGFRIYLAADATGSRFDIDYQLGLRRLDASGITLTSTETAIMEWCRTSTAPEFKHVSALIRETMPSA